MSTLGNTKNSTRKNSTHNLENNLKTKLNQVRADFPMLHQKINGKPYVYLDNAATTQKPRSVIDRITRFYAQEYATVHRGVYHLSQLATSHYDNVRTAIASFIRAKSPDEMVFTKGTTEGINIVAHCFAKPRLSPGDEVLITEMEHHANIVPWQEVCKQAGARLVVAPINDRGELIWDRFTALVSPKTKMVSMAHISNVLGSINPIQDVTSAAHAVGAYVLIDVAQSALHHPLDVQALDCDFLAFSAHKCLGPTGVGALYGKADLLDEMGPFETGGDMIDTVTFEQTTFAPPPIRFEAGTPAIAQVLGFGAAIEYIQSVGFEFIQKQESDLLTYATTELKKRPGSRIIGEATHKASALSFEINGIHPMDIGTVLDQEGVAIRVGHHCAQPLMARFGISATARASFSFYNTRDEVDAFLNALDKAIDLLS